MIRVRGQLRNPTTNAAVGAPFTLIDSEMFNPSTGNIVLSTDSLFANGSFRNELAKLRSSQFNDQNSLSLQLDTYIQFVGFDRSTRISGNVALSLISVSCPRTGGASALPASNMEMIESTGESGSATQPTGEGVLTPMLPTPAVPSGSGTRKSAPTSNSQVGEVAPFVIPFEPIPVG